MYEGSIPLEDFLDTLNRLQADFERRLGGIERKALPGPLVRSRGQERSGAWAWNQEDDYRPFGLEAIWTSPRTSPGERSGDRRDPITSCRSETLLD